MSNQYECMTGPTGPANSHYDGPTKEEMNWTHDVMQLIKFHTSPFEDLRTDQTIKNEMDDIILKLHAKKSPNEVITMANRVKETDENGITYQDNLRQRFEVEKAKQQDKKEGEKLSDERIIFGFKPEIAGKIAASTFAQSPHRDTIALICSNVMGEVNKMVKMQELKKTGSPQSKSVRGQFL